MKHQQHYHFKKSTSSPTASTNVEHFYVCPEEAMWDEVLRQFATFLDSCGYVGVFERVDLMLDNYWDVK